VLNKDAGKPIKLAVQPEGAGRIIAEYSSDTTLSNIIQSIELKGHSGKKKSDNEIAVVVYMRKEIAGSDLDQTTLKSLGLSGGMNAALRYFFKQPEVLHEQASVFTAAPSTSSKVEEKVHRPMRKNNEVTLSDILPKRIDDEHSPIEIDKTERSKDEAPDREPSTSKEKISNVTVSSNNTRSQNEPTSNLVPESIKAKDANEIVVQKSTISEPEIIHYIDSFIPEPLRKQRNAIIFRIEDRVSISQKEENISDDFFELNINDIKLLHAENVKNAKEVEEGGQLMTRQLRESQAIGNKLNLMNKYKKCIIRIQFPPPDRLVLQGTFTITETIGDVIRFVDNFIQNKDATMHLFTTPPKKILDPNASLIDENCFPSAVLHFGQEGVTAEEEQNASQLRYLKPVLLASLSNSVGVERSLIDCGIRRNVKERNPTSNENVTCSKPSDSTSTKEAKHQSIKNGNGIKRTGSDNSSQGLKPDTKVPKWFKPGKPTAP